MLLHPPTFKSRSSLEQKSRRKAQPRRLVGMSKLPQAASKKLSHDPWRAELGK